MELDQVVYEYGKLQLNFVACQRQATMLAQQVAAMNKGKFEADQALAGAQKRIAQLEKALVTVGAFIPEPEKDPEPAPTANADAAAQNAGQGALPPPIAIPKRLKVEAQQRSATPLVPVPPASEEPKN